MEIFPERVATLRFLPEGDKFSVPEEGQGPGHQQRPAWPINAPAVQALVLMGSAKEEWLMCMQLFY